MNELDQLIRFRDEVPLAVTPRAERLFRAALQENHHPERIVASRPRNPLTRIRAPWRPVRELRAEIPLPDAASVAAGRVRLLEAASAARPRATRLRAVRSSVRGRSFLFAATTVATSVAVAAGVVGYGLSTRGVPAKPAAARKTPAAKSSPTQATLAARILREASNVVERAPVIAVPAPGQWIYTKTIDAQYMQPTTSDDEWETFDGGQTAYYSDGRLIVHHSGHPSGPVRGNPLTAFVGNPSPETAFYALASLPWDPKDLLAVIGKAARGTGSGANVAEGNPLVGSAPKTKAQLEFDYLTTVLWNAAAGVGGPPGAEAAAFRAMATLPGITVQQGVKDAAGTGAIAVSDDGGFHQLLLDSSTYQVLGLRQLSNGMGPIAFGQLPASLREQIRKLKTAEQHREWMAAHQAIIDKLERRFGPPAGTVLESLAYARVSEVGTPGSR
jgi:hypothetical protein